MLELEGVESAYGSSRVLFGVDLTVGEGEVVSLLGRNGMGKTTTVRAITGLTPPRAGTIRFRGRRIDGRPAYRIARAGIG
ncbi:ATP-binding cassette domain-containing protein, partial [Arhodomonas sp. KWT]